MAIELLHSIKSIKATASLSTTPYLFVNIDSNGQVVAAGNGGDAIGVIQDKAGAGDPSLVCGPGDITKVTCGGSFNPGDYVQSNASGQAVKAVSGSIILGKALSAGANAFLADILFQPRGAKL